MESLITTNHIPPVFKSDPDNLTKSAESLNLIGVSKNKIKNGQMRRSKTLKDISEFKFTQRNIIPSEKLRIAKEKVDEAIKKGKVFAVFGPYNRVRQVLRNRGWVEKFYNGPVNPDYLGTNRKTKSNLNKAAINTMDKQNGNNSDEEDDDDDGFYDDDLLGEEEVTGLPPWEEEDGFYGIMSRMLRNHEPNLFWTLRKTQVDFSSLRKDQIVNHHARSGIFTTKTGIVKNLQGLRWYDKNSDGFFPRCFIISSQDDKNSFIENFQLTACIGLIKEVVESTDPHLQEQQHSSSQCGSHDKKEDSKIYLPDIANVNNNYEDKNGERHPEHASKSPKKIMPKIRQANRLKNADKFIEYKYLEMAIAYCEFYLKEINHEDIDMKEFLFCWKLDWDDFLTNYYKVVHEGYQISKSDDPSVREQCSNLHSIFNKIHPQFNMDGNRNVWILKPGAKSRGRGITCYSSLDDMLKLVSNNLVHFETRFIVQKYIERPLLVYNTKFDIRQWFLVTDWNPLTIWWYKDSYFRFCSQQFTLDDFDESVHLSNNSIQHKYLNGPRSSNLPKENMWHWNQFDEYLKGQGYGNVWETTILPGMKEAIINTLLCAQDDMEWRKNSFEMYGADFMVSEGDLQPWLIEINASPCLAPSTSVTARLTDECINDLFKVVLDRRENKNVDTGRFELLYKQLNIAVPPYIGINLKLTGTTIRNPSHQGSYVSSNRSDRQRNVTTEKTNLRKLVVEELWKIVPKKSNTGVAPSNESIHRLSRPKIVVNHKDEIKKRSQTVNSIVPLKHSKQFQKVKSRYCQTPKISNTASKGSIDDHKIILDYGPIKLSNSPNGHLQYDNTQSDNPQYDNLLNDNPRSDNSKNDDTQDDDNLQDNNLHGDNYQKNDPQKDNYQTKNSTVIIVEVKPNSRKSSASFTSKSERNAKKNYENGIRSPSMISQPTTSLGSSREYKMPTKVELINFSMSKHKSIPNKHVKTNKSVHSRNLPKNVPSHSDSFSSTTVRQSKNMQRKIVKNKIVRQTNTSSDRFQNELSQQVLVQNFPIQTGSIMYTDFLLKQSKKNSQNKNSNSIRQFTLQSDTIKKPRPIKIPLKIFNRSRTILDEINRFPHVSAHSYSLPVATNYDDSMKHLVKIVNNRKFI